MKAKKSILGFIGTLFQTKPKPTSKEQNRVNIPNGDYCLRLTVVAKKNYYFTLCNAPFNTDGIMYVTGERDKLTGNVRLIYSKEPINRTSFKLYLSTGKRLLCYNKTITQLLASKANVSTENNVDLIFDVTGNRSIIDGMIVIDVIGARHE